jgi:hypothetical protein
MNKRNFVWAACAAAVVLASLSAPVGARGGTLEKTMYLTFSGPVRLPGVSLAAGTYTFEIANPMSGADVVRVMSRDGRTSYFQGFTTPVQKPPRMRADAVVSLGEAAKGHAAPILAWYPTGESTGRQFKYND